MIVVAGAIANTLHNGGEAWVRLSWVLGLRALGYDVAFIEQISLGEWQQAARLALSEFGPQSELGLQSEFGRYFEAATQVDGIALDATLIDVDSRETVGRSCEEVEAVCADAELLVNISGHLGDPLRSLFKRKAFVDIDPGFTQIWQLERLVAGIEQHDVHFTIAENIGKANCTLPIGEIAWRSTRQPVSLEHWPIAPMNDGVESTRASVMSASLDRRFTTVSTWRCPYGRAQHNGVTYSSKHDEWRKLIKLPLHANAQLEVALRIDDADGSDRAALLENGWCVVDPNECTPDPLKFRSYVQASSAEFSPAQGVYVASNSGWISDRTARYLASGKPALVQDTGAGENIPVGAGLLTFTDFDSAVAGVDEIVTNYDFHARAARELAESYFDSKIVLQRFLEDAL